MKPTKLLLLLVLAVATVALWLGLIDGSSWVALVVGMGFAWPADPPGRVGP